MPGHACSSNEPRPDLELAHLFRQFGSQYRARHCLSLQQSKVMHAIEDCRTAALGGHLDQCDRCGYLEISYNSCGNRHCPKCQGRKQHQWVERQQAKLLPIEYFHVVFTLPDGLNDLVRYNERRCYSVLFKAATETLQAFAARHWQGRLGITAVLHTWGQNLSLHPHLHCVVTGGALSFDGQHFRRAPQGYLFPVRALSKVFRAKYVEAIKAAWRSGELRFPPTLDPSVLAALLERLRRRAWVVYSKRPFGDPAKVLAYLGRYTHRVAISNRRLIGVERGRVSFTWKDYRDGARRKTMVLEVAEFIRRYLQYVLPRGFVRLRHYGLHANTVGGQLLARCRQLLGEAVDLVESATEAESEEAVVCPCCGVGHLRRVQAFSSGRAPPRWSAGKAA